MQNWRAIFRSTPQAFGVGVFFCIMLLSMLLLSPTLALAGSFTDAMRAIEADDDKTFRALLLKGFDPNGQTEEGVPMISHAMVKGSGKVVRTMLLSKKLDPNQSDLRGDTPLMVASILDKPEWVGALITKGANLKASGEWTPLHYAATSGSLKTLALLLDAGADINALSPNGSTPLMMAARENKDLAVKLLLNRGADPRLVNQSGFNAAGYAMKANNRDLALEIMRKARDLKGKGEPATNKPANG